MTYTQQVRTPAKKLPKVALSLSQKAELKKLVAKNKAGTLSPTEKKRWLELGAIDFAKKFRGAMEKLSRE